MVELSFSPKAFGKLSVEISTTYWVTFSGLFPLLQEMVSDVIFTANVVPSVNGTTAKVAVAPGESCLEGFEQPVEVSATCQIRVDPGTNLGDHFCKQF